ncbi:MAG: ECF transporter S component [Clostridia bacterium]
MKEKINKQKLIMLTGTAAFSALVVVIQLTLGMVTIGTINLNFVLIPIVLSAICFGTLSGVITATTFGIVVYVQSIMGVQAFGLILYNISPLYTAIGCIVRSALVGLLCGLIYKWLSKTKMKKYLAYTITAFCAPIINTGIFMLVLVTLFNGKVNEMVSDGGTTLISFLFVSIAGINFIFEFLTTTILTPPIAAALEKFKNRSQNQ